MYVVGRVLILMFLRRHLGYNQTFSTNDKGRGLQGAPAPSRTQPLTRDKGQLKSIANPSTLIGFESKFVVEMFDFLSAYQVAPRIGNN
jgi:hypothetical protein